jgi:hypothetical protein
MAENRLAPGSYRSPVIGINDLHLSEAVWELPPHPLSGQVPMQSISNERQPSGQHMSLLFLKKDVYECKVCKTLYTLEQEKLV